MILVDTREPKEFVEALGQRAVSFRLAAGDFKLFWLQEGKPKTVLIERKAVSDLLSSLSTGRLMEQLRELIAASDVPILLIEGYWTATLDAKVRSSGHLSGWDWTAVQNFLVSAQLAGCYILLSSNKSTTVRMLEALESYFQKERHNSLLKVRKPLLTIASPVTKRVQVLMAIPGVGEELATRLLEKFGSLQAILNARAVELTEVKGIGLKSANRILALINKPVGEEGVMNSGGIRKGVS